jgi:hypothetical protein
MIGIRTLDRQVREAEERLSARRRDVGTRVRLLRAGLREHLNVATVVLTGMGVGVLLYQFPRHRRRTVKVVDTGTGGRRRLLPVLLKLVPIVRMASSFFSWLLLPPPPRARAGPYITRSANLANHSPARVQNGRILH